MVHSQRWATFGQGMTKLGVADIFSKRSIEGLSSQRLARHMMWGHHVGIALCELAFERDARDTLGFTQSIGTNGKGASNVTVACSTGDCGW